MQSRGEADPSRKDLSLEVKLQEILQTVTLMSRDWIEDAEISSSSGTDANSDFETDSAGASSP